MSDLDTNATLCPESGLTQIFARIELVNALKMLTRGRAAATDQIAATDAAPIIAAPQSVPNISPSNAMLPQASSASSDEPTQREAGLLGALRAACSLASVQYS